MTLQREEVLLMELLVLPTLSPPPVSEGVAVCVGSVLFTDVSPSGFGVEQVVRLPPLLAVDC